jgi:hypothetical protein
MFSEYRRLLREIEGAGVFCKIVLCGGFLISEFERSATLISEAGRDIPLIIQPASDPREGTGYEPVSARSLLECHSLASKYLDTVRIIPQCHRLLGIR